MRVIEILDKIEGKILTSNNKDAFFEGIYAGDLLSHVMAHAKENNLFLTIMSNLNTIAVACLLDMPVIVLAENVKPTEEMIYKADDENIITQTNKGEPVIQNKKAPSGKAYIEIAKRILGENIDVTIPGREKGFFAKIKSLLKKN